MCSWNIMHLCHKALVHYIYTFRLPPFQVYSMIPLCPVSLTATANHKPSYKTYLKLHYLYIDKMLTIPRD